MSRGRFGNGGTKWPTAMNGSIEIYSCYFENTIIFEPGVIKKIIGAIFA